jgi:hypothetical protein
MAVAVVLWEITVPTNLFIAMTPSAGLATPFTRIPFASNAFWHSVCHPGWIPEALTLAINLCHVRAVRTKAIAQCNTPAAYRLPVKESLECAELVAVHGLLNVLLLSTLCSVGAPELSNLGFALLRVCARHLYEGQNHLPLSLAANSLDGCCHGCLGVRITF